MGVKTPFSSLTDYASNPVISIVIALLIVIGGIGFLTWEDIRAEQSNSYRDGDLNFGARCVFFLF